MVCAIPPMRRRGQPAAKNAEQGPHAGAHRLGLRIDWFPLLRGGLNPVERLVADERRTRQAADVSWGQFHGAAMRPIRLAVLALVVVPTLWDIALLIGSIHHGNAFGDFLGSLWRPGHLIRHGANPYPSVDSDLSGTPTDYPPFLILFIGVPISFLGFYVAGAVWSVVLLLLGVATLKVLNVNDRRIWFVVLCSTPVVSSSVVGNATPLIVFLIAIAWRHRDRALTCGLAVGAAIAVKLFVVPLLVWLAASRRWRALAAAGVSSIAFIFGSWAVIGFQGLLAYPRLLQGVSKAQWAHSSSLYALVVNVDGGRTLAQAVGIGVAATVLVVWRGSFAAAVLASLLFSPVAWASYYTLLYIVAASVSTRLDWRWVAPLAAAPTVFWATHTRPALLTAAVVLAAVMACAPPRTRDRMRAASRAAEATPITAGIRSGTV
jgi:alpha-1,2-mannosyltransferase